MEGLIEENRCRTEEEFQLAASHCFLLFEKYRLKTNVVGINIEKDILFDCYHELQGRMLERYDTLFEHLQKGFKKLETNFTLAKATHLRTLNNIIRNYRRRVGLAGHEAVASLKYNRFDREEKILLESILYNEKDCFDRITTFQEDLLAAVEQGDSEIRNTYVRNGTIKDDYQAILEVIDKTECHAYKYYDNFQGSMQQVISNMEAHFDKLNGYLSIWENTASIKAYDIKSAKEYDLDERKVAAPRKNQEYTEEQLEELLASCPQTSGAREEYMSRLKDLRTQNKDKEKKMQQIGKMFNKRKNKTGILMNRKKEITVLDWFFDLQEQKSNLSFTDDFRAFSVETLHGEYRPTEYELQKPFKRQRLEEIKEALSRHTPEITFSHEWWYDRYGKDSHFDLILSTSQQLQKRVEFQSSRQTTLQAADDRRKRDILDKEKAHLRDSPTRDALHFGYMFAYQKEEIDYLQEKTLHTDYHPEHYQDSLSSSSIEFSSDSEGDFLLPQSPHPPKHSSPQSKQRVQPGFSKREEGEGKEEEQLEKEEELEKEEDIEKEEEEEEESSSSSEFGEGSLQERLIGSFFREYSLKVRRKEAEPGYKRSKFLYCSDLQEVRWQELGEYFGYEKVFIYTKVVIIYLKKVLSISSRDKLKCTVYSLSEDIDEEGIRETIAESFLQLAVVTTKFVSIYCELEGDDRVYFMVGLLQILVKEGEMPEDYDNQKYIREGQIIVDDFNCYFYPNNIHHRNMFKKRFESNRQYQLRPRTDKAPDKSSDANSQKGSLTAKSVPTEKHSSATTSTLHPPQVAVTQPENHFGLLEQSEKMDSEGVKQKGEAQGVGEEKPSPQLVAESAEMSGDGVGSQGQDYECL